MIILKLFLVDASGMDFRAMLKKKKYAKNQLDDQGPDWGDLKPVEGEAPPVLKKTEKVSMTQHIIAHTTITILFIPTDFRRKEKSQIKNIIITFNFFQVFSNVVQCT